MFMSSKREKLLAGVAMELLEHSQTSIRAVALDTLKQAIIRNGDGGTPQTKEIILTMAPILELAEQHNERVQAHDMAGCD